MKEILAGLFLATLSGSAFSAQTESCGYWEYYTVEVCDERQVSVTKDYTACEYFGGMRNGEALEFWQTLEGNVSCPSNYRTLTLTSESHYTKTVSETERYNCRNETRRFWVNEGGPNCGFDPRKVDDKK